MRTTHKTTTKRPVTVQVDVSSPQWRYLIFVWSEGALLRTAVGKIQLDGSESEVLDLANRTTGRSW